MSEQIIQVDAIEKWDIIERKWKIDWSEKRSDVQLDVAVLVQGSIVADLLEEVQARHQIAAIIASQPPVDDPAVW
mgnify:CR=1 FL=1